MAKTNYRDLAEFGLPLVGPDSATFSALVRDIQNRPQPFGSWPPGDLDTAAVLLNQSGKAIVILAHIWRYTTAEGKTRTSRYSNLGSGMQMDFLSGQAGVIRDLGIFILPGSKRLITERGMFGNNLDVLPPEAVGRGGGYISAGGSGAFRKGAGEEESAQIELALDFAVLEDGQCVGPDEWGLFEILTQDVARQRTTAQEIVAALHNGASAGQVFEILRPLARHRPPSPLLPMFANSAIRKLVILGEPELLRWFEQVAQSSPVPLHSHQQKK